ncbi:MAG: insulinase family protein [Bacteroidales bacterium]|jgi:predicted Zn-dependent peptidase|nr:insulinase family protein [Bacteroidales bacterium]
MIKFEKFTLNNGLKVIVCQDKMSALVNMNILYNVGARDENENKTGFAHLFEHLMFGGSKNIPHYDTVLQNAGGENNAFTNSDFTNYYLTIPKQNLETAFYLESDRMLELNFSKKSLDVQKNVVCEEFRQRYLNQPYGDVSLFLHPLAYKVHPYQWTTIGKNINHIESATLGDVKDFFFKHYAPNNAILVVVGDVTTEKIYKLSEKWFGEIKKRNVPIRSLPEEPEQTEYQELTLDRNVPNDAIFMAYHTCSRLNDNYFVTDLISDILSNGKSSFFNVNLIKGKQLFSGIDAYISGSYHSGLFHIAGTLYPNVNFSQAKEAINIEILKICNGDFTEAILQKVKNKFIANQQFNQINNSDTAMDLAYYEWLGDAEMINSISENYSNITKENIIKVAKQIFRNTNLSCILYKKI